MVSVSLYDRTTVPTIRSVATTTADYSTDSTSFTTVSGQPTHDVLNGETAFISVRCALENYDNFYSYIEVRDDLGNVIITHNKYRSGYSAKYVEWKNTSGATRTLTVYQRKNGGDAIYSALGGITRILIMNDSDIAKWERVNLPTTRYRKYAVDKYYMCPKWTSGSFNIDGYEVDTWGGGIVEVPVETIVSSTELAGSGSHFFQITGKGFTTTN